MISLNNENGSIILLCDEKGKRKIEEAREILRQLSAQCDALGDCETGGELGEAEWHLQGFLDNCQIVTVDETQDRLFTIWFQNRAFGHIVFQEAIYAKCEQEAQDVAREIASQFPKCDWFIKEGRIFNECI